MLPKQCFISHKSLDEKANDSLAMAKLSDSILRRIEHRMFCEMFYPGAIIEGQFKTVKNGTV